MLRQDFDEPRESIRTRRSASQTGNYSLKNKTIIVIAAVFATTASMQVGAADAASRHRGWHRHAQPAQIGSHGRYRHDAHAANMRFLRRTATRGAARPGTGGVQEGRASFYAGGGRTANGTSVGAATCAHRSLPFGTKLLVTNLANARQAILTVTDRGPFVRGRVLDVSRGAAGILGMLHAGVSQIRMEVLGGAG